MVSFHVSGHLLTVVDISAMTTIFNKRRLLKFPQTTGILWDQTPCGEAVDITLGQRPVQVQLPQSLWQNENLFELSHPMVFNGTVAIKHTGTGEEKIVLTINDIGHGNENNAGYCLVPWKVVQNTKTDRSSAHFKDVLLKNNLIKAFGQFRKLKDLNLSALFPCCGVCCYTSTEAEIVSKLQLMCVTSDITYQAIPVAPLPIICTALSRCLLTEMQTGHDMCKSGFLSMNETRHLLLVLDKDPQACSLPLVGVWISGVHDSHNAYVLAACMRYCTALYLKNRVCLPPDSFLVVIYVSHAMKPHFYGCTSPTIDKTEKLTVLKGSVEISHKMLNPHSSDILVGLELDETLWAGDVLNNHSCCSSFKDVETVDVNEMPRPMPNPHESELQDALSAPSVPDLSLFAENSALTPHSTIDEDGYDLVKAPQKGRSRLPELLQKVQCLLQNAPRSSNLLNTMQQTNLSESAFSLASIEKERIAMDISNLSLIIDQPSILSLDEELNLTEVSSKCELEDSSLLTDSQNKARHVSATSNATLMLRANPFCSSPTDTVPHLQSVSNYCNADDGVESFSSVCDISQPAEKRDRMFPKANTKATQSSQVDFFGVVRNRQPTEPNNEVLSIPNKIGEFERAKQIHNDQGQNEPMGNNFCQTVPKTAVTDTRLSIACEVGRERQEFQTGPTSQNTVFPVNQMFPSRVTDTSLDTFALRDIPLNTICDQPPSPACTIHLDLKEYNSSLQEHEFDSTIVAGNMQTNNVKPAESTKTFYQKMMDKVQWILTDESQDPQRNVSNILQGTNSRPEPVVQGSNLNLLDGKDSPFQNSCLDMVSHQHNRLVYSGSLFLPQLNYVSLYNSPDVSFQIDQLARKYLDKEEGRRYSSGRSLVEEENNRKPNETTGIALSFATCQYLEKHGLLRNFPNPEASLPLQQEKIPEDDSNYIAFSFATRQYLQRYGLIQTVPNTTPSSSPYIETIMEDVGSNSVHSEKVNILNIAQLREQPKLF